jgi:hypothetical protein
MSFCLGAIAQEAPQPANAPMPQVGQSAFLMHAVHKKAKLTCDGCHVAEKDGSVVLKRPGHDECTVCHQEDFDTPKPSMCAPCHSTFPPKNGSDLIPYPLFKKDRAILFEFSHAKHVDPQGRIDPQTRSRADCSFCHQLDPEGAYATFPGHPQCAACHSKPGMKPLLSPTSVTADCRGCHNPEEVENPGYTKERRMIAPRIIGGQYVNLKFSHAAHFKVRDQYKLVCTTCHDGIATSNSLASLTLPKMIDCVGCHETSKAIPAEFRMSNCQTCHVDNQSGPAPVSHTRYVKPDFHTESFRQHHGAEASAPGAKCFVCHTNVQPEAAGVSQCQSCHQVMLPISHTARWRDDTHGKYAAIDRESCSTCHVTDFCSRCHNELPRSHIPLPPFKNGGHAKLAMMDKRSCLTCHTYQDTCAECHAPQQRR